LPNSERRVDENLNYKIAIAGKKIIAQRIFNFKEKLEERLEVRG